MYVAQQHGLVFNGEKCEVKKDSVTFFGTVYNADGAHPDPKKVDAIHQMPSPHTTSQSSATVLGNGHLPLSIHPITLYTHCTTMGTTEKRLRAQVEHFLTGSLRQDQGIGQLFATLTYGHPSQCIRKGTWSCTFPGRTSSWLCSYSHRAMICQNRL